MRCMTCIVSLIRFSVVSATFHELPWAARFATDTLAFQIPYDMKIKERHWLVCFPHAMMV